MLAQINAPRAVKSGFLPPSAIQDVSASATFSIDAIEIDPRKARNKQVLRIHRAGSGKDAEFYYLSLRRPIGMDKSLAGYTHDQTRSKSYVDCLNVHRFKPDALGYRERMSFLVGLLKEKESYTDREYGITIAMDSLRDGVARVTVTFQR